MNIKLNNGSRIPTGLQGPESPGSFPEAPVTEDELRLVSEGEKVTKTAAVKVAKIRTVPFDTHLALEVDVSVTAEMDDEGYVNVLSISRKDTGEDVMEQVTESDMTWLEELAMKKADEEDEGRRGLAEDAALLERKESPGWGRMSPRASSDCSVVKVAGF